LCKTGVLESVTVKITGHSTGKMFDYYNTIDEDDTRKAIKWLEAFFVPVGPNVDQIKK
jgi:hypothetical protein